MANGRPDDSVSRESNPNLGQMFESFTASIKALEETIKRTSEETIAALDTSQRYGVGSDVHLAYRARQRAAKRTPDINSQVLRQMTEGLGISSDATLGMTRVNRRQASTSFENARAMFAQRLGESIAGRPLYGDDYVPDPDEIPPGGSRPRRTSGSGSGGTPTGTTTSSGSGPSGGSSSTPAGTPTSAGGGRGGSGAPPYGGDIPPEGWEYPHGFGDRGGRYQRPRNAFFQNLGARIAQTGGQPDRLAHALGHLPGIGLVTSTAGKIGEVYRDQREKNRFYQNIEGGSNFAGFGERLAEERYRWGNVLQFSGDMSRQAFKEVTNLGYTDATPELTGNQQNRQSALDFVTHNYNARGMDVQESVGILQTASKNASVSLNSVSTALKDVSDTSRQAGVNAKEMREHFNAYLQTAIGTGAAGGAPQLAQGLASMQASYGRQFQTTNFSGEMGPTQQYMMSGQYGIAPAQTQYLMRTHPQQYSRMLTGSHEQWIQNVLSQEQIQDIKQLIQKYGGPGSIDESKAQQISNEFLNKWQAQGQLDLNVISQQLSQLTSVELTPDTVMPWIVEQLAGNTEASHAKTAAQQNSQAPVGRGKTGGAAKGKGGLAQGWDEKQGKKLVGGPSWQHKLQYSNVGFLANEFQGLGLPFGQNPAANAYIKSVDKTGKRDPVLESLIQTVKNPGDAHVKVSTKGGERVLSFEDAMKQFPNEIASGKAVFVDGDYAGKNVQQITGDVDANRNVSGELKKTTKSGEALKDWQKDHPGTAGGGAKQGRVTVDLTNEAKKLLQLLPNRNNGAANQATVPQNPNAANGSRGGG